MSRSKQAEEPMVRDRAREVGGWRTGRPVEDPQKTKRFGLVQAKPSEFLVHVARRRPRTSTHSRRESACLCVCVWVSGPPAWRAAARAPA
jgi:hypothetical protein